MYTNRKIRRLLLSLVFVSTITLTFFTLDVWSEKKILSSLRVFATEYLDTELVEYNENNIMAKEYIPGDYLTLLHSTPSKKSYCKFFYRLPKNLKFSSRYLRRGPEQSMKSKYKILYNVIKGKEAPKEINVTFATHVTANYVNYIPEILRFWEGPISVAAFVPDLDVAFVLEQITQYCYCLPDMERLSLHLVYPIEVGPSIKDVYFTPPDSCEARNSRKIKIYTHLDEDVVYNANVARNAARTAVKTHFVLVSDAEFIPSKGLAARFTELIKSDKDLQKKKRRVFVVPTFEIDSTENIPRNKTALIELIKENKARYYNALLCKQCHQFPNMTDWLSTDPQSKLKIFGHAKREFPYHKWLPTYISTKSVSYEKELLSWEGLQNRDPQFLEMCLKGYSFDILDGAFLVHWPKKKDSLVPEEWRSRFVKDNSQVFQEILKSFLRKYRQNQKCMLSYYANHQELDILD